MDSPIQSLPNETLYNILLTLSYKDVLNFCITSSTAKSICESDLFWQEKARRDFGIVNLNSVNAPRDVYDSRGLYRYALNRGVYNASNMNDPVEVNRLLLLGANDSKQLNFALTAASCNGNIQVSQLLVNTDIFTAIDLLNAFRTAVSCLQTDTAIFILDTYLSMLPNVDPSLLRSRVLDTARYALIRHEGNPTADEILFYLEDRL